jgi:hypothetical protein
MYTPGHPSRMALQGRLIRPGIPLNTALIPEPYPKPLRVEKTAGCWPNRSLDSMPRASDAALDAPLSEANAAKTVIVRFIGVEFVRPAARPTIAALDGRDGVPPRGKGRAGLPVGARDFDGQRDAVALDHHVALAARFASIGGVGAGGLPTAFGRYAAPIPAGPAPIEMAELAEPREQFVLETLPNAFGLPLLSACASRSCPDRNPVLWAAVPRECRCAAPRVCPSTLVGEARGAGRRAVAGAPAAAAAPAPPTRPHPEGVLPSMNVPSRQAGFRGFVRHSKYMNPYG